MVAEVLAGIALVKASITGIKGAIGVAKDIGAITRDIDNLFDASKQLKKDEKMAKATGASATQIVIDQELAKEAIKECNKYGDFLNSSFIVTNVKTLSFKEIKDFLVNKKGED